MTIVVDTNVIAYLHVPSERSGVCERIVEIDRHWIAPVLWRSELRNVLALYLRKNLLDLDAAYRIQAAAEALMAGNGYEIPSRDVLELAAASGRSAYDCEFVALARSLGFPLVTADAKLVGAFPDLATTPEAFVERHG